MVMKHILMDVYTTLNNFFFILIMKEIHFSKKGCRRGALTSHEIYNDVWPFKNYIDQNLMC